MLINDLAIAFFDFRNHVFFMVNSIISKCLISICMLSYSNFDSSTHRKTFNAVFWDLIAHFFHVRTDINSFFTEHTIGPVGRDVP